MLTQVIDNLQANKWMHYKTVFYSVRYVGSLFWTSGCVLVHKYYSFGYIYPAYTCLGGMGGGGAWTLAHLH